MSVTETVIAGMDIIFAPIISLTPLLSILVFAAILSVVSIVFSKLLMKKGYMKEMKMKQKELQKRMKDAQKEGDQKTVSKNMKEMMSMQGRYMKDNMKPMIATLGVGIVILLYMSNKFAEVSITLPFEIPLLGSSINWIWWYIIASVGISMGLRKAIGEM